MHRITTHNIITLLRTGAFGRTNSDELLPMSPHKWRQLLSASELLGVAHFVCTALRAFNDCREVPVFVSTIIDSPKMQELSEKQKATPYNYSDAKLYNLFTSRRWEGVVNEETSLPTISETTLNLLDIIIANMDDMITGDIKPLGIVTLGLFLRQNKNDIDYNKLQRWLTHIGLVQVAALEGSMLIECFGFAQEELPFVNKIHKNAGKHIADSISNIFSRHSFSYATRYNVAMLETLSNQFSRVIDIEE